MSTLAHERPATRDEAPTRLISLPLALTFLAEFTSLTSFFLLLSVLPMLAAAAGASSSGAGLITGSLLLGTVVAEAAAAPGIRRFGYRTMLAAGAVLLGAPALALIPREPQAVMMGVSFVRGLGFGLCGVATGALAATLLPPERRGEGLGLLGVVSGVPAVVALPAGVWLAGHHLATAVAAMAAAFGLLPLTTIRWLPGRDGTLRRPRAARTRRALGAGLRLALIFAACTIAAGVLDSFLPLVKGVSSNLASVVLLVQAIAATVSRWQAGRYGDKYGHARLLIPALIVAALGLAAMIGLASPVLIFTSMVLFGAGFGILDRRPGAGRTPGRPARAKVNMPPRRQTGASPSLASTNRPAALMPPDMHPARPVASFKNRGGVLCQAPVPGVGDRDHQPVRYAGRRLVGALPAGAGRAHVDGAPPRRPRKADPADRRLPLQQRAPSAHDDHRRYEPRDPRHPHGQL